ncbi:MAG: tyrosine-type recombinase/integrase [bacterium]
MKDIENDQIHLSRLILKSQTDRNGQAAIYIRVRRYDPVKQKDIINRKINTGVKVVPKHWSKKKGIILSGDPDYANKNQKITQIEIYINYIIEYPNAPQKPHIDAHIYKALGDVLPINTTTHKSLVDYIDAYYNRRKELGHPKATVKEFLTVRNRIEKFDHYRGQTTYMENINISWSDDFELYLSKLNYKTGTIRKTYVVLCTILNYYYEIKDEKNIKLSDKFKSPKFKRGKNSINEPNPLSEDQLLALYGRKFIKPHLERARKLILIQCFSGVRYSDLNKIKKENIKDGFLIFKPNKTLNNNIEVEQPINKFLDKLLKQINYDIDSLIMTNQAYNRMIKEVFSKMNKKNKYKKLKYRNDYTSHNFRDTFISLAVHKGVNLKSILKWVGQSSYQIMDRYIKLDSKFQQEEMNKMFDDIPKRIG